MFKGCNICGGVERGNWSGRDICVDCQRHIDEESVHRTWDLFKGVGFTPEKSIIEVMMNHQKLVIEEEMRLSIS